MRGLRTCMCVCACVHTKRIVYDNLLSPIHQGGIDAGLRPQEAVSAVVLSSGSAMNLYSKFHVENIQGLYIEFIWVT